MSYEEYYKKWLRDNGDLVLWVDKHINFKINFPKLILEDEEDDSCAWAETTKKIDEIIEAKFEHKFKISSEPNFDCNGEVYDCWVGAYLTEEAKNDAFEEPIFAYSIIDKCKPVYIVFKVEREFGEGDDYYKECEYYSIEEIKKDLKVLQTKAA